MGTDSRVRGAARGAVASLAPFSLLRQVVRPAGMVAYYHMISDDEVLHIKHLYAHKSVREFTDDLDFLLRRFAPVTLDDVIGRTKRGEAPRPNTFHLTFDDGFREMADVVAPILVRKGVAATFFINTAFLDNAELCYLHKASLLHEHVQRTTLGVAATQAISNALHGVSAPTLLHVLYCDRQVLDEVAGIAGYDFAAYLALRKPYLSTDQVNVLLRDGFTIGAHSIDHPLYRTLTLDEQLRQTMESLMDLRRRFALSYGAFAFPHTDHGVSMEFFERLRQSGCVDVTFGTSGMLEDVAPNNRQRVNLEKPRWPARNILQYELARRLYKRAVRAETLIRH